MRIFTEGFLEKSLPKNYWLFRKKPTKKLSYYKTLSKDVKNNCYKI